MSFKDLKGINLATPFKYQAKSPLDLRTVVDTTDDLNELVTINAAYEGLQVYVRADDKARTYNGSAWVLSDTVYTHPANHPASMITQDATHRFMTDTERTKLNGIETGANKYVHPATHSLDEVTETTSKKIMTATERTKLAGIAEGANKYTHPASHPATMITEDATHRFMTDAERTKLEGIAAGANKYSHPATHSADMITDGTTNVSMTAIERTKLEGIAEGANKYAHPSSHSADMITDSTTKVFMTPAERTKLAGIAEGANKYSHPTGAGNNHIPTGGAANQILKYSASGVAVWANEKSYGNASASASGLMTAAQFTKLAGIADNANNYTHPASHSLDIITETTTKKIMTDAERTKLANIANNANNYNHPASHAATMIDEDTTHRFVTDDEKTAWNNKANASHGTHVTYATVAPKANGTAAVGTSAKVAREDHVHPLQTTVSGNAGTATKLSAQKTISLTGDVTGSVSTDFSGNASITTTVGNDSHTHGNSTITSLDASKLTGTIDIERLPHGALERCINVEDDTARFKLTTKDIQNGDTVKVVSTGKMYFIVDDTKLSTEDGYDIYTAGSATSVPWAGVTGKPSTFTPSAHNQAMSTITGLTDALAGKATSAQGAKADTAVQSVKIGSTEYKSGTNVVLPAYPTTLPASDVAAWAKAASKPTYSKSEVGLGSVDNAKQVKGLASGTTANHVVTWGADGYSVKDSGFTIGASVPAGAKFTDTVYTHPSSHSADMITDSTTKVLMTPAERTKLAGIADKANNYTHPSSHSADMITDSTTKVVMTAAERTKLAGIAEGANKYAHPTGAGNNHIPTGGASNQILRYSASGVAVWSNEKTYSDATATASGLMSAAQFNKLAGIAENANNYTHPANHPATMITADATHRFVTDTEKNTWNAKANGTHSHSDNDINSGINGNKIVRNSSASTAGSMPAFERGVYNTCRANRLAFLPPAAIIAEYSVDGGSTWTDAGLSDDRKKQLVDENRNSPVNISKVTPVTTSHQLRLTFSPTERYAGIDQIFMWFCTNGHTAKADIEASTIGAKTTFTKIRSDVPLAGWSGNNSINIPYGTFGGGDTQNSNRYSYRITIKITAVDSSRNTTPPTVTDIRFYGDNVWTIGNEYMYNDHMYKWDLNKNVTFPAKVTATSFSGSFSGNASTATKATQDSAGQQINTTYIKGLSVSGKVITYTRGDGTTGTITTQDTNTTYGLATTSADGLMSKAYASKLDGIAANANNYTHPSSHSADMITDSTSKVLMTPAERTKLNGIATGANNYTHPTTSGNKHIPSGGSSGQILRWSADGTAAWGADNNTTYSAFKGATSSAAGGAGLVPAPASGATGLYLKSDGTWGTPTNTTYGLATASADGLMSKAYASKLDGIAAGANNYSHPTGAGNNHIPAGGAAGQFLKWSAAGVAVWANDNNTTYSTFKAATASAAGGTGLVPAPEAGKQGQYLRGDGTWATPTNTVYTHPANHPATMITEDATHRFMTDTERTKLNGIATGANNYTHPTSTGNKHIPSGGASGQILRWSSDGTAVWGNDNNTTYSAFTGATSSAAGSQGLVPAPATGAANRYLRSDGTWQVPPDNNTTYGNASASASGLMTAAQFNKLAGIAEGANKYTHPTGSGNNHIPAGGASGQIIEWSSAGTGKWVNNEAAKIVDVTKAEFNTLVSNGTIDNNKFYNITDDFDSALINDSSASTSTVYSSSKVSSLLNNKSGKSSKQSITMNATSWSGSEAPYTITLSVSGATASNNIEVLIPGSATNAQVEAWMSAAIVNGTQASGSITLKAYGEKPGINIPIEVIVRNDI